ncbi:MAG: hypothetical protein O9294_17685 [Cytophagales bacterium]|jgi:hypothetical protein|nr:hypothetical protein [Cytophagales bacterium]
MAKKKTWLDKLNESKQPHIVKLEKAFAGIPAESRLFIPSPKLIDEYIQHIGYGKQTDVKTMRNDLAIEHNAENTCPVTTAIFLRIVAEANYEKFQQGTPIEKITPFWRVIEPQSTLSKKLTFGQEFIINQREAEK